MEKQLKIKKIRGASLERKKAMAGYVFVLPFLLGIILVYLPILLDSILFSFYSKQQSTEVWGKWVYNFEAFKFYGEAFSVPDFSATLLKGLQQLVTQVPAVIIFSLFIAVVLNQKMLGRSVFRAIFFVPVIISTGLMESINGTSLASQGSLESMDDGSGSSMISITQIESVLRSMDIAGGELVVFIFNLVENIFNIINYSGVQMLIFLAGLQSISESIYEACRIDGATGWETFWKVTFPMISPMILVNTVYTVIDYFTRPSNSTMQFISGQSNDGSKSAMYWIYFMSVILIIAVVAALISTFIFYQRKD